MGLNESMISVKSCSWQGNKLYKEDTHKLPQFVYGEVMMRIVWKMIYGVARVRMKSDCVRVTSSMMLCCVLIGNSFLTEAFLFFLLFTCYQSSPLVTTLSFMKIITIILQSIWTLLGL